jgi:polysaccharide biosynthesis/export protein
MKRILIVLFASLFILNSGIGIGEASEEYRLCPRDVLSISVWGIEDLKVEGLEVREDGKIVFPVVGEIQVAGLLPRELMQNIASGLNGYVNNPIVSVNILKYHTTRIYVVGEVVKPGLYELEKRHKLMDAITIAGGYTKDAAKKKVIIMSQDGTSKPLEVNLLELLKKGDMTQNISLKDEDIVYLTENGRIDLGRDIIPVIGFWSLIRNF